MKHSRVILGVVLLLALSIGVSYQYLPSLQGMTLIQLQSIKPRAPMGNLFVTQSTTPVRSHMLLGGTLGDDILRLELRAENEDIDVTLLTVVNGGGISSIDRLELYRVGESTPFAHATIAACGAGYGENVYCARMQNRQLVVPKTQKVNVVAKPRMKTDTDGAVSGQVVDPQIIDLIGLDDITASGISSGKNLQPNDGDSLAEGEIFIGTSVPAANKPIIGRVNRVVLSKVTSITNADPNPNGTAIPQGQSPIGQFKFKASPHENLRYGSNTWTMTDVIFTVSAVNVQFDDAVFVVYNKADSTAKSQCHVLDSSSSNSQFFVACWDIPASSVYTGIDAGGDMTIVLEATIVNPRIQSSMQSFLQVSMQQFWDPSLVGMASSLSHIRWIDKDASFNTPFFWWIEYPDTTVNSTAYQS